MNTLTDKHTWRNDRGLLEYCSLCDEKAVYWGDGATPYCERHHFGMLSCPCPLCSRLDESKLLQERKVS